MMLMMLMMLWLLRKEISRCEGIVVAVIVVETVAMVGRGVDAMAGTAVVLWTVGGLRRRRLYFEGRLFLLQTTQLATC
jgi:hypothetical protein